MMEEIYVLVSQGLTSPDSRRRQLYVFLSLFTTDPSHYIIHTDSAEKKDINLSFVHNLEGKLFAWKYNTLQGYYSFD